MMTAALEVLGKSKVLLDKNVLHFYLKEILQFRHNYRAMATLVMLFKAKQTRSVVCNNLLKVP